MTDNDWSKFYCKIGASQDETDCNPVIRIKEDLRSASDDKVYVVGFEIYRFCSGDWVLSFVGSVQWDGCCNWQTAENQCAHFCGVDTLDEVKDSFKIVYALAHDVFTKELDNYERPEINFSEAPMVFKEFEDDVEEQRKSEFVTETYVPKCGSTRLR